MRGALERGGLELGVVGYLNLHGTATPANDSVEAAAVAVIFSGSLYVSLIKVWIGYIFGAAGIVESVIALLALRDDVLPGMFNSEVSDLVCGL